MAAACCWTLTGMVMVGLVRTIGPLRANHMRLWFVSVMLLLAAALLGEWAVALLYIWPIVISGVVGIAIGDCLLFSALKRLGPSRNFVTFSSAAPFGVLLAFLFYGEILSSGALVGCLLVIVAIMLASKSQASPKNLSQKPAMDDVSGSSVAGLVFGLFAGFCQAAGAVIIKPALAAGADPLTLSALRVIVGAGGVFCLRLVQTRGRFSYAGWTPVLLVRAALSGFLGMGLGMTLLIFALAKTKAGIALTLSSITPLLSLLAVYALTKRRPTALSWCAALLAIIGVALLFY